MDYTNEPAGANGYGLNNQFPNNNDYSLLTCIYASVSSCASPLAYLNSATGTTSSAQSDPTNFGIRNVGERPPADVEAGNSVAEWGKAVAFTSDGRGRVYERVIAPGRKIITHVFLVPR